MKKSQLIDEGVFQIFLEKLDRGLPIHDRDLRQWAMKINRNLESPMAGFKASTSWVKRFKRKPRSVDETTRKYSICSRKITDVRSRLQNVNAAKVIESADVFVKNIKSLIERGEFKPEDIFNCDQSNFNKEMVSFMFG